MNNSYGEINCFEGLEKIELRRFGEVYQYAVMVILLIVYFKTV